jgi:hypothetical protein
MLGNFRLGSELRQVEKKSGKRARQHRYVKKIHSEKRTRRTSVRIGLKNGLAMGLLWACYVTLLRQGGSDGSARRFSVAGEHPHSCGLGLVQLCEWLADERCFRASRDHGVDWNCALRPHWCATLLKPSDGSHRASSLVSNLAADLAWPGSSPK